MTTTEPTLTTRDRTFIPRGEAAALLTKDPDGSTGRVLVTLPDLDAAQQLPEEWTPSFDERSGLHVQVRRAACDSGCRCDGEIRLASDAIGDPIVQWPDRVALTVHVVLELDEPESYFADDPDDYPETEGALRDKLAGDFAGFVLNEINNCPEYGATALVINADVTEVSR